jgi:hypothetical protein
MWQKGQPGKQDSTDEQSFAYYEINGELIGEAGTAPDGTLDISLPRYEKMSKGYDGSESKVKVPVSVWNEETNRTEDYSSSITREEIAAAGTRGVIKTVRSSTLKDTGTIKLYTRVDTAKSEPTGNPLPIYDYNFDTYAKTYGAYRTADNRIAYSTDKVGEVISQNKTWESTLSEELP